MSLLEVEARRSPRPVPWGDRTMLWGLLIAVLVYIVVSIIGGVVAVQLGWRGTPWITIPAALGQIALLLPPLVIILRQGSVVERLGLDRFDLKMLVELIIALILAFAGMFFYGLLLAPFGVQAQEPLVPLVGDSDAGILALFLVAAVMAPIFEEVVFRGFLFAGLRERMSPGQAALLSGAAFGLLHLQPLAFPVLMWLGVLLALLYHRTGSLWMPIIMHFVINSMAVGAQFALSRMGEL